MSTEAAPVLSVIIPVWNGARYLAEAIESVLAQDAPPFEVIVVDDGSEDESAAVAERYGGRVTCLRRPHAGLAASRNTGVDSARGKFLMHLDADDVLRPESIAVRMDVFTAKPDTDMVIGFMESFVSPELPPESAARFGDLPGPQRGGLPGTSIVRAASAARVGKFKTHFGGSPDLDWMMRAQESKLEMAVVPEVVLRRRIHGNNLSLNSGGGARRLQILRAALDRRRGTALPGNP